MGRTQTITALLGGFVFVLVATDRADAGECGASDPECHLANGQRLLASDPHRAADELYASYRLDERTETLTLYAQALARDGQHARALETWQRIILFREAEIESAKEAMGQQSVRKRKAARAQLARAQEASEEAATAIMTLWPKVAKVTLTPPTGERIAVFAGAVELDATKEILVNAGRDELRIAWPNGTSTRLVVEVPAGQLRTVDVRRGDAPVVAMTAEPATPAPKAEPARPPAPMPRAKEPPPPVVMTATRAPMTMRTDEVPRSPRIAKVGLAVAAGGVVALGVAGSFAYLGSRDFDRARTLGCDSDGECPVGPAAEMGERAHDRTRYAQITAIGGGALVATGVTMWLLGRRTTTRTATDVTLSVGPQGAGIGWSFQ